MTWMVLFTLIALMLSSGSLLSCSSSNPKPEGTISQKLSIPEHFKYIPADTPYVVTGIKSVPYQELGIDVLATYKPLLKTALDEMRREMANTPPEYVQPEERLLIALFEELEPNFTSDKIKNLGLTMDGHLALYGIGMLPVLRVELADAAKFEAFFTRMEGKSKEPMPMKMVGTKKYKMRYLENNGVVIPMIITDTELIVGVTPKSFEADFVSYMLGEKKFAKSMFEDNKLIALQKQEGYKPYAMGYFDVERIVNAVVGTDTTSMMSNTIGMMFESTKQQRPQFSEVCKKEIGAMGQAAPRVLFGYNEFSKAGTQATVRVEINNGLSGRFAKAKATIPGYDQMQKGDALLSFGWGVSMAGLTDFVRAEAQAIADKPFQCEGLQDLNSQTQSAFFSMQQLPPFATSLQGISFSIQELDLNLEAARTGGPVVKKILAALVLGNADPQQFYTAIQAFVPELSQVSLTPSGQPIAFQLPAMVAQSMSASTPAFIGMSQGALGVSVGQGADTVLANRVNVGSNPSPVFFLNYDMAQFGEFMKDVGGQMSPQERGILSQLTSSYDLFESLSMSLDADDRGFSVVSTAKLKPQAPKK